MNSTARAMAAKRIVFSRIGMLGSDVLFRPRHCYHLTRGGRDYPAFFVRKFHGISPRTYLEKSQRQFCSSSLAHLFEERSRITAPRQANGNETLVLYSASTARQLFYQLPEASVWSGACGEYGSRSMLEAGYF